MQNSKQLAALIGPVLVAITLSEIVNAHIWIAVTAPVTYQAGVLAFVAGISIVRAHNLWPMSWPVTITLVGWFGIFAGLIRMFATDMAQEAVRNQSTALGFEIALLVIGILLTFKAYGPGRDRNE